MGYLSIRQTSEKWNLSPRWINDLCSDGRIPGAMKIGSYWAIPEAAHPLREVWSCVSAYFWECWQNIIFITKRAGSDRLFFISLLNLCYFILLMTVRAALTPEAPA